MNPLLIGSTLLTFMLSVAHIQLEISARGCIRIEDPYIKIRHTVAVIPKNHVL